MSEELIFQMYRDIQIYENDICTKCKNNVLDLSPPISIWQVGKEFYNDQYKILFVGKNARGTPGKQIGNFYDSTERADSLIDEKNWHYWSYTKAIFNEIYPDSPNAWEKVAFTNLVKCNDSDTIDTTRDFTKKSCVLELQVFKKELAILKPRHIVFYTGRSYDFYIQQLLGIEFNSSIEKIIGAKKLPWCAFEINEDGYDAKCLRISHPERKKKDAFVTNVVTWVKNN